MSVFDFGDGRGPVPAHRHRNKPPHAALGGWVADTAFVDESVVVEDRVQVFGKARVFGKTSLYDGAKVFGSAEIHGDGVQISMHAQVFDNAKVQGAAVVSGRSRIYGSALVHEQAKIYGLVQVCGSAVVGGGVRLEDSARLASTQHIRWGDGWYAYETPEGRISLCAYDLGLNPTAFTRCLTHISYWSELPKALHTFGFISTLEYLAQALEPEPSFSKESP